MAYMLMILEPRGQRDTRTTEQGKALYDEMLGFAEQLAQRGLLIAAESLRPDRDATRLSLKDGKQRLLDGPFTETKEMVGGFFLINCESKQQALEIAATCPAAAWATVEVRETAPCYV